MKIILIMILFVGYTFCNTNANEASYVKKSKLFYIINGSILATSAISSIYPILGFKNFNKQTFSSSAARKTAYNKILGPTIAGALTYLTHFISTLSFGAGFQGKLKKLLKLKNLYSFDIGPTSMSLSYKF